MMLKGRVGPSLGGRAGALVPLKQSGGLQSHIYVSSKTVLWASSASPAAPAQVKRPTLTAQAIRPVVFFMDATAVRVPLEPQQFLGLAAGHLVKDSEMNQACDQLKERPLEPGYSQQIEAGRSEVLSHIRSTLIQCKRIPLEQREHETSMPAELLPACLALLVEVGQNDLVLELGTDLLSSSEIARYPTTRADVLLSLALAKCNMAHEEFSSSSQVAGGCQHLEEALQLLTPKGMAPVAPALIREVRASLAQLACQCALEKVSVPATKENSEERRAAVRQIREILRQSGGANANANTEFMTRLVAVLSCDELVHLQEWEAVARHPQSYTWVYPGLIERIAYGHILFGYMQCQPAYMQMAMRLLKHLQSCSEVTVAMAMCQLLLGNVHNSLELLKQAEAMTPRAVSTDLPTSPLWGPQAHVYVERNTPPGDDGMLAGLCKYTQLWLSKVALPLYPDMVKECSVTAGDNTPMVPNLENYFENTRVEALITVYDEKTSKGAQLPGSVQDTLINLRQGVERIGEAARTSLNKAGASASSLKLQEAPVRAAALTEQLSQLSSSDPTAVQRKQLIPAAGAAAFLGLLMLLWPRGQRADAQLAATDAAGGAQAVTATAVRPVAAAVSKASAPVVDAAGMLQPKMAEQILRQWQEIKSCAMGEEHDVSRLSDVLLEPALGKFKRVVTQCADDGMHMTVRNRGIKIRDVDSSRGPSDVRVFATLIESAQLYQRGKEVDAYDRHAYNSEYQFVRGKDGVWRIAEWEVEENDQQQ